MSGADRTDWVVCGSLKSKLCWRRGVQVVFCEYMRASLSVVFLFVEPTGALLMQIYQCAGNGENGDYTSGSQAAEEDSGI